ncbi:hypothetical protein PBI_CLUBL_71 [Gordonia phage ClubL]|uniref:Uncharacterized protein n=1 Tax=Gordonia phage ClubL TaxID=1838065 RepID=A0A160DF92_9CAUD|nr:hypothetical protein BH768_gp136 [Gordonia phage ClubL]ANA86569.1 hypothetical protein PBI_CLUBL_71 [Gordonia phage ClubL]
MTWIGTPVMVGLFVVVFFVVMTAWAVFARQADGLLGIPLMLAIFAVIIWPLAIPGEAKWVKRDLVSISDGTGVHGYFVFGTGSIDSDARYRFYWKQGNQLMLENVQSGSAALFEIDGLEQPYFETRDGCRPTPDWLGWCWDTPGRGSDTKYRIYVPTGSVTTKIDLNLNP